jgi:hypothetical protein
MGGAAKALMRVMVEARDCDEGELTVTATDSVDTCLRGITALVT